MTTNQDIAVSRFQKDLFLMRAELEKARRENQPLRNALRSAGSKFPLFSEIINEKIGKAFSRSERYFRILLNLLPRLLVLYELHYDDEGRFQRATLPAINEIALKTSGRSESVRHDFAINDLDSDS